jgi:predicted TIM-barrel fold metal-dependent hydrolase
MYDNKEGFRLIIDVSNTIGRTQVQKGNHGGVAAKQMDAAGIDKAVVSCYAESLDNESVFNAIHRYPDRFIGLYTVNRGRTARLPNWRTR